jgi:CBS domain-containing protein
MSSPNWFRDTCVVKVGDVCKEKPAIISVDCRTTIAVTLDVLNEKNVTTLAVHGEVGHWLGEARLVSGSKQYIGMVSILDILSFLMKNPANLEAMLQSHISDAIGSTPETLSVWTESADRPLFFCMEQFCRGTHHAFCVSGPTEEPKMLSQSDLVAYVLHNESAMPHISDVLNRPLSSIASNASDLVRGEDKLSDAMHLLVRHHALPIVGADGSIISTLSATDMKGQLSAMVAMIAPMSVMDYILYRNADVVPTPFAMPADTTVRAAAQAMLLRGMHRIWIQPPTAGALPGVMSLTDVIRLVFTAELPA